MMKTSISSFDLTILGMTIDMATLIMMVMMSIINEENLNFFFRLDHPLV